MKIETVARKAGYKRGTYYLHIKNKGLSFEILKKYGKAIVHDFCEEIPEMATAIAADPDSDYHPDPLTMEEAIVQRNEWKEKYLKLLEKYVSVIEKQDR